MTIIELKERLCELVDTAYQTAIEEGHQEIIHPFLITLHADGSIEYAVIGRQKLPVSR